jgi:hypothetical protein
LVKQPGEPKDADARQRFTRLSIGAPPGAKELFMKRNLIVVVMAAFLAAGVAAQGMMGGYGGYGRGMMGGYGGMYGQGMMGAYNYIPLGNQAPLTIDQAAEQAKKYLASWGDDKLQVSEIMEFSNQFYIEIGEKGGDQKALELIMNKYTGAASPEPGPNMMWNQKYGMMANGMMGVASPQVQASSTMPIGEAKARELAQKALDAQQPGLKVEEGADRFYGYYTLHALKDGAVYGMLGVNGYTGQVWYHSWHGKFVAMKEFAGAK